MQLAVAILVVSTSSLAQTPKVAPAPPAPAPSAATSTTTTAPPGTSTSAKSNVEKIAIIPLRVEALSANEVKRIGAILRARTETRGGYVLQSQDTTDELADSAQALGLDCALLEVSCAAQLGKLADVQWVITGAATRLTDRVGVELRLVHVGSGALRRQLAVLLPTDPDAQVAAAASAFEMFFDENAPLGRINLAVQPVGAKVSVDGAPRGKAPLTLFGLVPGEHEVAVGEEGFEVYRERIVVAANGVVDKKIIMVPGAAGTSLEGPTEFERTAPLIVAGAGGAAAIAGLVVGFLGAQPALAYVDAESRLGALDVDAAAYPADAQRIHGESDAAATSWNDSGRWLVTGGVSGVVLGAAAIAAGLTWGGSVWARAAAIDAATSGEPNAPNAAASTSGAEASASGAE